MKVNYEIDLAEEIKEAELEDVSEAEKMLIRYVIEHDPKKKVIEIRPGSSGCILLRGVQDAMNFIEEIEDIIQQILKEEKG